MTRERDMFELWARDNVGQPSFAGYYAAGAEWVYRHNIMQLMWTCWRDARRA